MEQLLLDEQYGDLLLIGEQYPDKLQSIVLSSHVDKVQHLLEYNFERYFVVLQDVLPNVVVLSWDTTLERSLVLLDKLHDLGIKINDDTMLRLTQSLWISRFDPDQAAYLHCVIADRQCLSIKDRYRLGWSYPLDDSKIPLDEWQSIKQLFIKIGYHLNNKILDDLKESYLEHIPSGLLGKV